MYVVRFVSPVADDFFRGPLSLLSQGLCCRFQHADWRAVRGPHERRAADGGLPASGPGVGAHRLTSHLRGGGDGCPQRHHASATTLAHSARSALSRAWVEVETVVAEEGDPCAVWAGAGGPKRDLFGPG